MRKIFYAFCIITFVSAAVMPAFASTVIPKPVDEETKLIDVKEGDTLWSLAREYFKNPRLWELFNKYNNFSVPNQVFPGDSLQVPLNFPPKKSKSSSGDKSVSGDKVIDQSARGSLLRSAFEELKAEFVEFSGHSGTVNTEFLQRLEANEFALQQLQLELQESRKLFESMSDKLQTVGQLDSAFVSQRNATRAELSVVLARVDAIQTENNARLLEADRKSEQLLAEVRELNEQITTVDGLISLNSARIAKIVVDQKELPQETQVVESPTKKIERKTTPQRTLAAIATIAGVLTWILTTTIGGN